MRTTVLPSTYRIPQFLVCLCGEIWSQTLPQGRKYTYLD
nr:MAG TPA: hypothetical protein [Caudoviricetes sp.]